MAETVATGAGAYGMAGPRMGYAPGSYGFTVAGTNPCGQGPATAVHTVIVR